MTVLVEARCHCGKLTGTVVWAERFEWSPGAVGDGIGDVEAVDEGRHLEGSSRAVERLKLADSLVAADFYGHSDGPIGPTHACDLDHAPLLLRGWCPDHGGVPLSRDDLVVTAQRARREGKVRRVVVQRT